MTIAPDGSVFIQIANFVLLIWILNMILYKPIRGILKQRKDKMNGLSIEINESSSNAQAKKDELEAGLAEAKSQGIKAKDALTLEAEEEERRILAEINRKAAEDLEKMRADVAADVAKAESELEKEVQGFAAAIGQKILGRAI